MRFLAGLFFGFTMGILFVNLVLGSNSMLYKQGFEDGKNYTPPTMKMIDSLTIPEFTAKERMVIAQFMIIIKKASEVK